MQPRVDGDALTFFNRLSGRLQLHLSDEPVPISPALENLRSPPAARVLGVTFRCNVHDGQGVFRPLTEDELGREVIREPRLRLIGEGRDTFEVVAPNGVAFTVRDLIAAIEQTERQTRGDTSWFGGVDAHHVFFEGIHYDRDGVWRIAWGS